MVREQEPGSSVQLLCFMTVDATFSLVEIDFAVHGPGFARTYFCSEMGSGESYAALTI